MKTAGRARLFVALELPREPRGALERWRAATAGRLAGLRPVPEAALHVTLCFLGWRERSQIEQIGAACEAALKADRPLPLSLGRALWLPARRPRVLAVEIEDPSGALADVQASLAAVLSGGGWFTAERRPFLGHVTVARVGRDASVRGVELRPAPSLAFTATSVTLFRSHLERSGARYEALRRIELQGGDRSLTNH